MNEIYSTVQASSCRSMEETSNSNNNSNRNGNGTISTKSKNASVKSYTPEELELNVALALQREINRVSIDLSLGLIVPPEKLKLIQEKEKVDLKVKRLESVIQHEGFIILYFTFYLYFIFHITSSIFQNLLFTYIRYLLKPVTILTYLYIL